MLICSTCCSSDPEGVSPGGEFETLMKAKESGDKCVFKKYTVNHGFVSRGDLAKEDVKKAVEDAMKTALTCFNGMD